MPNYKWAGDERCEILQRIKREIQEFNELSPKDKQMLNWAIERLLDVYGCSHE